MEPATCAVCTLPAGKSCSACCAVYYCSVDHQKSDWKNHKKVCQCYKVETNEEIGRHLVASRDLKTGTLVLKEVPLASCAKIPPNGGNEIIPLCLGCYCIMMDKTVRTATRCSKCNWPICKAPCEKIFHHADNECEHFAKHKIVYPANCNDDYYHVFIFRICLLKHRDPSTWNSIMTLQHDPSVSRDKYSVQRDKETARKLVEFFKLTGIVTADEWYRLSLITDINTIEMSVNYHACKDQPTYQPARIGLGCILALKASMFSHSCAPNCTWAVSPPARDMTIQVRTAVDIVKGEVLNISYNIQLNLVGTQRRRKLITNFVCQCVRCVDPTELGSNASTVMCTKCNVPALVSTNPLEDSAPWKCESCGYLEMNGMAKVTSITRKWDMVDVSDPNELQAFITRNSGISVHPNHWIVTEATRKLVKYLSDVRVHDFTMAERATYISSCKFLLKIAGITAPGLSKERAHLQHMIAKETVNYALQEYSKKTLSLVEFQKQLKVVEDLQDEAYKFFKTDCSEAVDKSPIAAYLEEQMKFVKFIYRGTFTLGPDQIKSK